ncbi:unnamed protein product [Nezara viridula]|uniref:Alkaline ceramidase n=1 Tax=Nezara viridula TaxID=85310 RepID=A0A9P0HC81_NEZVI|nr:unnamed protein product [Nezara viridula]
MPPVNNGYWGEPTATIDWCEENYVYSYYIAEMTNTITNLIMIILPLWGIMEVIKQELDWRFIYLHSSILIVGLGSWAFHMTLLYGMQLFDELPMIWGTCFLIYYLSEVQKSSFSKKMFSNQPLFIFLSLFAVIFTAIYLLWPQPLFQHISYGVLVFTTVGMDLRLLKINECKTCKKIFLISAAIYLFGFILWNLDKIFCQNLRLLRLNIPGAFDPFTQLHGWWHLMSGYASYSQVLFIIHASYDFKNEKQTRQNMELQTWRYGFSLGWFKKSHDL